MASPNCNQVIVGNIPEGMDKEALRPIMEEVGRVKQLDLVYHPSRRGDNKMPRHKGYGFCEYFETAAKDAAIRNLSKRNINGAFLRIRSADGGRDHAMKTYEAEVKEAPRLDLEGNMPIAQALRKLTLAEVYEAMEQMKQFIDDQEDKASLILRDNPQLGMALLQVLYYMGIVTYDPEREQERKQRQKEKARALGLPTSSKRARTTSSSSKQSAPASGLQQQKQQPASSLPSLSDISNALPALPSSAPSQSTSPTPAPGRPAAVDPINEAAASISVPTPPQETPPPTPPASTPPPQEESMMGISISVVEENLAQLDSQEFKELMDTEPASLAVLEEEQQRLFLAMQDLVRKYPEKYPYK
ncbi:Cleavage stimulating factor 64 [Diplonema papillatum]|nr:Cleavage stimulating factor 64 [Diplonema papillatum]